MSLTTDFAVLNKKQMSAVRIIDFMVSRPCESTSIELTNGFDGACFANEGLLFGIRVWVEKAYRERALFGNRVGMGTVMTFSIYEYGCVHGNGRRIALTFTGSFRPPSTSN